MNKKASVGLMVVLFLGVVVALAMLPAIANNQKVITSKLTHTNETVNVTAQSCYTATKGQVNKSSPNCNVSLVESATSDEWEYTNCHISGMSAVNKSGDALTLNTSYTFYSDRGTVQLLNVSGVNKSALDTIYMTYTYCGDGYGTSSGTRSVAGLITLTAGLGVIGFSIYYFMKGKKW